MCEFVFLIWEQRIFFLFFFFGGGEMPYLFVLIARGVEVGRKAPRERKLCLKDLVL